MNSAKDVWAHVLDVLSKKLTSTAVDTWFSDTEAVDIREGCLILHCPSAFKRETLKTRLNPVLKETLDELFSGEMGLIILEEGELESFLKGEGTESSSRAEGHHNLTFSRFIVGNNNKFAHAAALGVAENLGTAYNPVIIYGKSGLGKTHLLYAIYHAVKKSHPNLNIVHIKGEGFTNELIESIRNQTTAQFNEKYRSADLFLVDDVQFIAGKEKSQEAFVHTFNTLYEAACPIVMTADQPPSQMPALDDRLISRLEWGLLADIKPPDYETRVAIVKSKAGQLGIIPPEDVIVLIAEKVTGSVRRIESAVKRLAANQELLGGSIDKEAALRAIEDIIRPEIPTPKIIIEEAASFYQLSPEDVRGSGRTRDTALARQVSMYLIRSLTDLSLSDIGKEYKGKSGKGMDHSSVLSSIDKIKSMIKDDPAFGNTLHNIQSNIVERN